MDKPAKKTGNSNYPDPKDAILKNIKIDPITSCWMWQRAKDSYGYGQINLDGKMEKAHRISYRLLSNPVKETPIPDGLCIMHSCDNPACVNPMHLTAGTQADNMADMVAKGRSATGEKNGGSKLTKSNVNEIREKYSRAGDYLQSELASEYGVSKPMISYIVNNKNWDHLNDEGEDHEQA